LRALSLGSLEWKDELEQLWLDRRESRTRVEAPGGLVAVLNDDTERSGALRDRISLCVGEQPVPNSTLLVARRDEELFDHDHRVVVAAHGDIAGKLSALAGNED
jgi:hypothetical protein